jgi:hypothetical protein
MHDPKCAVLAAQFLADHDSICSAENVYRIAEAIQRAIEDEIADLITARADSEVRPELR